jgi:hypothetical protein
MLLTGAASSLIMPMVAPGDYSTQRVESSWGGYRARDSKTRCIGFLQRGRCPLGVKSSAMYTHHSGLITFVSGLIGAERFERKSLRERSRNY